jgi:histidinol phosphatase-like PHP family hydrolase
MNPEERSDPPLSNPFAQPGQWYKGCLHGHTTRSDGKRTPEQIIDWYRRHGYHFLALTDHSILSESRTLGDDFCLLSGIESEGIDPQMGV